MCHAIHRNKHITRNETEILTWFVLCTYVYISIFISLELHLREFSKEGSLFVRMPHNGPDFIIPLKKTRKNKQKPYDHTQSSLFCRSKVKVKFRKQRCIYRNI